LVDDVQENRALLEVLLKKMGYLCKHGTNGQEAVEICRQERFDLILMDLQMPLMDGFAAIQQIRSHSLNQKTPILAMTASGQRGDDLKALEAGCNDCLSKPVNGQRLQRKVWRLLAQEKQIQAAESGEEILSFLEGDPDYQKAVETFVENLPAKIEEMRKAFEKKDLKDLAFKAHALKGLGGFAGFPVFTEKAKSLEETVKAADLERIGRQLDEMVQLCMRTRLQNK
jgi:CheY-like chemotaxis protein